VDAFEDDGSVYIVQELCRGGELHHRIGERHYSERTVRLAGSGGGCSCTAGPRRQGCCSCLHAYHACAWTRCQ
jgi:serine/threonine protein kinase